MAIGQVLQNRFQYIEDAREFALKQPGSEAIRQEGAWYIVELIPWKAPSVAYQGDNLALAEVEIRSKKKREEAFKMALEKHFPAVEFLFDADEDGAQKGDQRYTVDDKQKIHLSPYPLTAHSLLLMSPEDKAIAIVRKAMANNDTRYLIDLAEDWVAILQQSPELSAPEKQYVETHLNSPAALKARRLFVKFIGAGATFRAVGTEYYTEFVRLLNDPKNDNSLALLHQLAQNPETFQNSWAEDEPRMVEVAQTLKRLPGFRRWPASMPGHKEKQKLFEDALRTIQQYTFKFHLRQGMDFNRNGLASHGTELNYRVGQNVFTLGFSGRDFDFTQVDQVTPKFGYSDNVGNAKQRLLLGYSSGFFDVRLKLARDEKGDIKFERPESEAADRYIARKKGDITQWAKHWAKENPVATAGIVIGALAGVYAYSKLQPNSEVPLDMSLGTTLYERENFRAKIAAAPKLTLKDGKIDLGLKEVGIGFSGNAGSHFYDANVRQRLENTSIRSRAFNNRETEVNLRYGYDTHSVTLDERYNWQDKTHTTRLGYRQDFVLSPGFRIYASPYVQTHGQKVAYQTAGASVGVHKEFLQDRSLSVDVTVNYDYQGGVAGGFVVSKSFASLF